MVTKHGRPAAVLISPDELESLEETLSVLEDSDAVRALRDRYPVLRLPAHHWVER